ncbi:hypothetical protein ACPPVT_00090 [Angustibacter sp. McL0619]|uniref:hypothetical protein n=1 Tax=Angustibacter sp. McL0619 TaxID=3415676 RepID=UPI003CF76C7C
MNPPQWWSQRFAAEGGAAAEGISKQLGRPPLDLLTILVRESAQNSWDARLPDGVVDFSIRIHTLGDDAQIWRRTLLPGPKGQRDTGLEEALVPGRHLLIVSDRGTRGLGGPLRADEKAAEGVVPNFVQFLRNVGEPSDQEYGGGTYGFGKGILYMVSSAHAILVDTKCQDGAAHERRLMGASLAHSFYEGDVRYTGRHWWGDCSDDVPDPVTGEQAAGISNLLGLPGFGTGETGSDIVILGADLGSESGEDGEESPRTPVGAGEFLASSILWHLWPKAGSPTRRAGMRFRVTVEGQDVPMPAPSSIPQLQGFVKALDQVRQGDSTRYERSVAPLHGGDINIQACPADPMRGRDASRIVGSASSISAPYRHIARMRTAELVVDYLEGHEHPDPLLGYVGVFVGSRDADPDFAASEPPTHDDWVERGLTGRARGVVRGSKQFIRNAIAAQLPQPTGAGSQLAGLGRFASQLAGLASVSGLGVGGVGRIDGSVAMSTHDTDAAAAGTGLEGTAPGGASDAAGTAPKRRRAERPSIIHGPVVELHGGEPMVVAHIKLPAASTPRRLSLTPHVVLEGGGRESEPPAGLGAPDVVGWWPLNGSAWLANGPNVTVAPAATADVLGVAVRYTADVTIRFELDSEDL